MAKLNLKTIEEFENYLIEVAKVEIQKENAFRDNLLDAFIHKVKSEVNNVTDIDYSELHHCEDGKVDFHNVDKITVNIDFKNYWVQLVADLVEKKIYVGNFEL